MGLSRRTGAQLVFGLAGATFLTLAFLATWDRSRDVVSPGAWRLGLSWLLALVSVRLTARGWAALLAAYATPALLARSFLLSQPGKYIPGGIWQGVGQVHLTRNAGVPLSVASAAFPVYVATIAAAGLSLGAGLTVFGGHFTGVIRFVPLAGTIALVLLHRAWMLRAAALVARLVRREFDPALLPSQAEIIGSFFWTVGAFLTTSVAFAVLVPTVRGFGETASSAFGFALAWTVGYAAIPVPAGVGVREAVLVGTLAPVAGSAALIAASVLHRLVSMIAEATIIAAVSFASRRRP